MCGTEMVYNVTYIDRDNCEQCIDMMSYEELEELRSEFDCSWQDADGNEYSD